MRCFLIAVSIAFLSHAAQAAQTWAVLVGVSQYQSQQVASLHYPAADATSVRDALVDPQLGGLPPGNVQLLADAQATSANIQAAVDALSGKVKAGDSVVLFLAGHGITKGAGAGARSFFLPTDVRGLTTTSLESSAVDVRQLANKLGEL